MAAFSPVRKHGFRGAGAIPFPTLPLHPFAQFMTQASPTLKRSGPLVIAVLATLLLILHQDYWFWTNKSLVFGILPIGLFWHICISLAAVLTWALATRIAWPFDSGDGRVAGRAAGGDGSDQGRDPAAGEVQH